MKRNLQSFSLAGVVLIAAAMLVLGLDKLAAPDDLASALREHGILPLFWQGVAKRSVPVAEIAVAIASISLVCTKSLRWLSPIPIALWFGILLAYSAAALALGASGSLGCGCGMRRGPIETWWPLVMQNAGTLAFIMGTAFVLRGDSNAHTGGCLRSSKISSPSG